MTAHKRLRLARYIRAKRARARRFYGASWTQMRQGWASAIRFSHVVRPWFGSARAYTVKGWQMAAGSRRRSASQDPFDRRPDDPRKKLSAKAAYLAFKARYGVPGPQDRVK